MEPSGSFHSMSFPKSGFPLITQAVVASAMKTSKQGCQMLGNSPVDIVHEAGSKAAIQGQLCGGGLHALLACSALR